MKNRIFNKRTEGVLSTGVLAGLLLFVFTTATLMHWQKDGFDMIEISLMTVLSGFYLFIGIIFLNIFFLNKSNKYCQALGLTPMKGLYQVLLTVSIGFVVFLLMDVVYFQMDQSVSIEFANSLRRMAAKNGDSISGIDEFAQLPFGVQNGILTFVLGLFGSLLSLILVKREGELFKTQVEH